MQVFVDPFGYGIRYHDDTVDSSATKAFEGTSVITIPRSDAEVLLHLSQELPTTPMSIIGEHALKVALGYVELTPSRVPTRVVSEMTAADVSYRFVDMYGHLLELSSVGAFAPVHCYEAPFVLINKIAAKSLCKHLADFCDGPEFMGHIEAAFGDKSTSVEILWMSLEGYVCHK